MYKRINIYTGKYKIVNGSVEGISQDSRIYITRAQVDENVWYALPLEGGDPWLIVSDEEKEFFPIMIHLTESDLRALMGDLLKYFPGLLRSVAFEEK